ncbi:MAG TPA: hypothetical protein VFS43_25595 [Polyangiaceae bacterium]|nr:hypothetical protein [Polyangiaceae bacterium]
MTTPSIDYQALYENLCNLLPKPSAKQITGDWEGRGYVRQAWPLVTAEGRAILRVEWRMSQDKIGHTDVPLTFAYGGIGLADLVVAEKRGPFKEVDTEAVVYIIGRALAYLEREHGCMSKGPPRPLVADEPPPADKG